jgi:phosphate starvation-inducible PhoH-like protein
LKYLVDTNILLSYPEFVTQPSIEVILTYSVICELDKKKYEPGTIGLASRQVSKWLDRARTEGDLAAGVETEYGNKVYVIMDQELGLATDDALVAVGSQLCEAGADFILLSNDINVRIKSALSGVKTAGWGAGLAHKVEYAAIREISVSDDIINLFYANGSLEPLDGWDITKNSYVMLRSEIRTSTTAIGFFNGTDLQLITGKHGLFGIRHKNVDQMCAIDALARENIPLVTMVGKAGSGKTLLAIAAALDALLEKRSVEKILLVRPPIPVGKDVGFLPGPQPLDAKVLTPSGWTTMGEIKVGDMVVARDGSPAKVLGVYPKGKKPVYRLTTIEGSSTEACLDHLWMTQTANDRKHNLPGTIKTTAQLSENLMKGGDFNQFLPRPEPVQFAKTDLPVPAYTLGALLGDGSICDSIILTGKDQEIFDRVAAEVDALGCKLGTQNNISRTIVSKNEAYNQKTARRVVVTDLESGEQQVFNSNGAAAKELGINKSTLQSRCDNKVTISGKRYEFIEPAVRWTNPIKNAIHGLGLLGHKADTKFIPPQYKYGASVEDRIALLQGLMDTDGTIKKNGEMTFCTVSKRLAEDVREVVRSLGGKANIRSRNRIGKPGSLVNGHEVKSKLISYEFNISLPSHINPFYITRKAKNHISQQSLKNRKRPFMHGLAIKSIELSGEKEVQCIMIDHPEHLYITDDYIVTHNTIQEKMAAWAGPLYDNLDVMMKGKGKNLEMYIESGAIEVVPPAFMRGRSLNKTFVILDEGQSLTRHEMKTIATRIGEGSKLVVTGDLEQIDNPRVSSTDNGLAILVETFRGTHWAVCLNLVKGERSDFASAAAELM